MGKLESRVATWDSGLRARAMAPGSWPQHRPLLASLGLTDVISWGCIAPVLGATGFDLSNLRPLATDLTFVSMLSLLIRFNDAGLIVSLLAESRGASMGRDGVMVMLPWDCGWSDYRPQDGMLVPMVGEVAWVRPESRRVYFVGHVKKLRYEFLP